MDPIAPVSLAERTLDEIHALGAARNGIDHVAGALAGEPAGGQRFADVLANAVGSVVESHEVANAAVLELAAGRSDDLVGTMLAVQKAGLSTTLALEIRNKLLDAYQEIMRINA